MRDAGLDVQGCAGLVLLALVGEVALYDVKHFGDVLVQVRRDDRAGLHREMQHHGTQRVVCVADRQSDVAFAREWKTIRLDLTVRYFLVDHDMLRCSLG
jgi:hypothetical protein